MKERVILHSDMNCYYASVEMMLDPTLRGKPVAVCGSTENRHGIVLTASYPAKRCGVKTGMANWEARRACPNLICVPPHYDQYLKYSKIVRRIYEQYTDLIEPYGLDECWLDVSGSTALMGSGEIIAERIRQAVKSELGLTVSIGVSFNKVFAKLGSDLKKPDAITVLDQKNWKERVWPLPVSDLLFCGRATTRKLAGRNILTIGDLANADPRLIENFLHKPGLQLWEYANGRDYSRVAQRDFVSPIKSVGHGITARKDLTTEEDVWRVMLELSQDIGHRLRIHHMKSSGVSVFVKDKDLDCRGFQAKLSWPTQSPMEIAEQAFHLFQKNYFWHKEVRAVTVSATNLVDRDQPLQLDLFGNHVLRERRQVLEDTIDEIRNRFGKRSIYAASLMGDLYWPTDDTPEVHPPGRPAGDYV